MPFLNESLLMYDRREFLIASGQLVSAVMVWRSVGRGTGERPCVFASQRVARPLSRVNAFFPNAQQPSLRPSTPANTVNCAGSPSSARLVA